jgi:hypothetical protein
MFRMQGRRNDAAAASSPDNFHCVTYLRPDFPMKSSALEVKSWRKYKSINIYEATNSVVRVFSQLESVQVMLVSGCAVFLMLGLGFLGSKANAAPLQRLA